MVIFFLVVFLIGTSLINNPTDSTLDSQNETEEVKITTREVTTRDEIIDNFVKQNNNVVLRQGLANPRIQIRNSSGTEVIGLDHNGTVSAINLEIDFNGTFGDSVIAEYFCNSTGSCWSDLSGGSGGADGNASSICVGGAEVLLSNGSCMSISNLGGDNFYPTYINLTASTYNGSFVSGSLTGYAAAHAICDAEFTGSHLCNEFEVDMWFKGSGNKDDIETADTWVSAGGPKFVPADIPVNDCNGWTHGVSGTYLGNYYHFDNSTGGDPRALHCGSTFKLTCCTYV